MKSTSVVCPDCKTIVPVGYSHSCRGDRGFTVLRPDIAASMLEWAKKHTHVVEKKAQ